MLENRLTRVHDKLEQLITSERDKINVELNKLVDE